MRYKNFTFPHEPEKLEIGLRSRLGVGHCPGYGPVIQELGVQQRVITGEGSFFGEKAGEQYRRLEALFFQQTPGVLILPGHSAVTAHFSRLGWLDRDGWGEVIMCFSPARRDCCAKLVPPH